MARTLTFRPRADRGMADEIMTWVEWRGFDPERVAQVEIDVQARSATVYVVLLRPHPICSELAIQRITPYVFGIATLPTFARMYGVQPCGHPIDDMLDDADQRCCRCGGRMEEGYYA